MRIAEYIVYFLLLLLFILWQFVPSVFPNLNVEQLLSILVGVIIGSFFNFYEKLKIIIRKLKDISAAQVIQIRDLNSALQYSISRKKDIDILRIYAISTGVILPIVRSIANIKIGTCVLLLKGFENPNAEENKNFAVEIDQIIRRWMNLKEIGIIKHLEIFRYTDHPSEYNCIIDNDSVIIGLYSPNPTDDSKVKVINPMVITQDAAAGKLIINQYIQRFDELKELSFQN